METELLVVLGVVVRWRAVEYQPCCFVFVLTRFDLVSSSYDQSYVRYTMRVSCTP